MLRSTGGFHRGLKQSNKGTKPIQSRFYTSDVVQRNKWLKNLHSYVEIYKRDRS
jgi:hypothetical protein